MGLFVYIFIWSKPAMLSLDHSKVLSVLTTSIDNGNEIFVLCEVPVNLEIIIQFKWTFLIIYNR